MQYEILQGINYNELTDFMILGLVMNFVASLLSFLVLQIKLYNFEDDEYGLFIHFIRERNKFIISTNHPHTIILNLLLIFLPMYQAWINLIFLWHLITKPGPGGVMDAYIESNKFQIIQLIRYKVQG